MMQPSLVPLPANDNAYTRRIIRETQRLYPHLNAHLEAELCVAYYRRLGITPQNWARAFAQWMAEQAAVGARVRRNDQAA